MSIRLVKALVNYNIALDTAINFLRARKDLGEINSDATVSTKISEEQYEALAKEFGRK